MKELNEYKAEIYRRSEERNTRKKIARRRTATLCIVLALCISLGAVAVFNFSSGNERSGALPVDLQNTSATYAGTSDTDGANTSGPQYTYGHLQNGTEPDGATVPVSTSAPNSGEMITVNNNGLSTDLMEGISSNREVKDVDVSSAAAKLTDFAVRLFKQANKKGESTLVSPLSVITALAMTANGAEGETLKQMEKVFGMDIDTLNEVLSAYCEMLPQGNKYKLDIANAIWFKTDDKFSVNKNFLQKNADWYGAGLYAAPFNDQTLEEINAWVKINTRGMIEEILDQIPPDAVMYLVNALAFQAEWNEVYDERHVGERDFTLEDGTAKETEFMFSQEGLYLNDGSAEGFIKYYKDKKYAFAALLPNEGVRLSDYVDSLTGEKLYTLLSNAQKEKVNAAIPKFKSETSLELSDVLKKMGMPASFDGNISDFGGIGSYENANLYISRVLHKTFIEVAEQGTKAGAATAVEISNVTSAGPMDPKQVYLDRPFVYMLIDCETNTPFFIGTLTDIEQSEAN
ncbi:MAG: serpin family protein [Clostridia bacterium]|nr:serpin family protein [Clostridia bacterium]